MSNVDPSSYLLSAGVNDNAIANRTLSLSPIFSGPPLTRSLFNAPIAGVNAQSASDRPDGVLSSTKVVVLTLCADVTQWRDIILLYYYYQL